MNNTYRKKPVEIQAIKAEKAVKYSKSDWTSLPDWLEAAYEEGFITFTERGVYITTLEGTMSADPEDMIIQGVEGEIYPCKPEIFKKTYEKVEEPK